MKRLLFEETLEFPLDGDYKIISGFGPRKVTMGSKNHEGVDIKSPEGVKIKSVLDGKVVRVATTSESGGYGNMVIIKHNDYYTLYGHMSKILTKVGDEVKKGQVIGLVGSTGRSEGPHLHFEIRKTQDGNQIDPEPYLNNTQLNPPIDTPYDDNVINPEKSKIELPIDSLLKGVYKMTGLSENLKKDIQRIKNLL